MRSPGVLPIGSPPSTKMGVVADGVTSIVSLPARALICRNSAFR